MRTSESFDSLIASSGRLRILAALVGESQLEFVGLRAKTQMTDGNLATHTRRLESAGFVKVEKSFRDRKPVTKVNLTVEGRRALEEHARELLNILGMTPRAELVDSPQEKEATVSQVVPVEVIASFGSGADAEDWVD